MRKIENTDNARLHCFLSYKKVISQNLLWWNFALVYARVFCNASHVSLTLSMLAWQYQYCRWMCPSDHFSPLQKVLSKS